MTLRDLLIFLTGGHSAVVVTVNDVITVVDLEAKALALNHGGGGVGGGAQQEVDAKVKAEEGGREGHVSVICLVPVRVWV